MSADLDREAWAQDGIRLYHGDAIDVLASLAADSVDCVVTSPPYWGLRAYSGEQQSAWAPEGYGAEPTPELYVEHTVGVLRAIRRVLKPSGVVWWNVGDTYAANRTYQVTDNKHVDVGNTRGSFVPDGLKPKDLVLIPQRVALAAQADGWWVRSDVIWAKPNPMPESVTDRPTKAHEYVFLLTKSERYFWDQDAVREPWTSGRDDMREKGVRTGLAYLQQETPANNSVKPNKQDGLGKRTYTGFNGRWDEAKVNGTLQAVRNIRSVWTIPTQPSPLPHFASFPEALVERCIKAACPPDGIVLDPFVGTGTTLKVARDLGRKAIGIEISREYVELAVQRLSYGVRGVLAMKQGQGALL